VFTSIVIRNEIVSFDAESIRKVLSKDEPYNVTKFKLEFCKIDSESVGALAETLMELSTETCSKPGL